MSFDVIVAGAGGFGSSCLYHLARRGLKVLGLDRFPAAHDRGSSHGETRIIRQAYFEHPDYVPLLRRSYELWRELESESQRELMRLCGLLLSGPEHGEVVPGARLAAAKYGVPLEQPARSELAARFPGFRFPEGFEAVFEPLGGYLRVEDCVRTHLELAMRRGAVFESGHTILDWQSDGRTVRVRTDHQTFEAAALVLTPGAWAGDLLRSVPGLPLLEVRRKVLLWHPVRSPVYNEDNGGGGFLFEMPGGVFYGFPSVDQQTVKLAEHSGGARVNDPLTVDRALHDSDREPSSHFVAEVMPDLDPHAARHAVCLYTMTPDQHFLVDRHAKHSNVVFGAGFSGHGFKFTSALGEALAEMVTSSMTPKTVEFLSLKRFRTSS